MWIYREEREKFKACRQSGLRVTFDMGISDRVKKFVRGFAAWLRERFYFPVRVNLRVKNYYNIEAAADPRFNPSVNGFGVCDGEAGLIALSKDISARLTEYFGLFSDGEHSEGEKERWAEYLAYTFLLDGGYSE